MLNSFNYNTMQGDTFDMIALDAYNEETKSHVIIQANPEHRNVLIFEAGVSLVIPIIEEQATSTLPPWKQV